MATLPREQLVQRHGAAVSAPGVLLWHSTTNLTTCEVHNIDLVTEGEVEEAQMAPPEWFFDVVVGPDGVYPDLPADVPDGIYQNHVFDGMDFGEGSFGGLELEWNAESPYPIYWSEGDGEDGVYP